MKKMMFALLVGLMFVLALPSVLADAHGPPPFSGDGEGTQSSPYIITNPQQLDEVRNNLTAYYILENDIDLNVSPYNENFGWNPIGTGAESFKGNFDGKGYSIYNLFHNSTASDVGLFGVAESCISISNFSMKNVYIKSIAYTGSIVGILRVDCLLTNVNAHGEIESEEVFGGLVGWHTSAVRTILNSYSNVSIKGNNIGGGLVGLNDGLIENSYSLGYVDVNTNSGGLIGVNTGIVNNSFYDTNMSGQNDTGKGTPKTTNEMQDINTFNGWDIALIENFDGETWFIDDGNDYPRLFYQYVEPEPEPEPSAPGSGGAPRGTTSGSFVEAEPREEALDDDVEPSEGLTTEQILVIGAAAVVLYMVLSGGSGGKGSGRARRMRRGKRR